MDACSGYCPQFSQPIRPFSSPGSASSQCIYLPPPQVYIPTPPPSVYTYPPKCIHLPPSRIIPTPPGVAGITYPPVPIYLPPNVYHLPPSVYTYPQCIYLPPMPPQCTNMCWGGNGGRLVKCGCGCGCPMLGGVGVGGWSRMVGWWGVGGWGGGGAKWGDGGVGGDGLGVGGGGVGAKVAQGSTYVSWDSALGKAPRKGARRRECSYGGLKYIEGASEGASEGANAKSASLTHLAKDTMLPNTS